MSYQAIIIVLALALLLSGVAKQADNDLNEALGIKHTPLLQLIVGIGTGLLHLFSISLASPGRGSPLDWGYSSLNAPFGVGLVLVVTLAGLSARRRRGVSIQRKAI